MLDDSHCRSRQVEHLARLLQQRGQRQSALTSVGNPMHNDLVGDWYPPECMPLVAGLPAGLAFDCGIQCRRGLGLPGRLVRRRRFARVAAVLRKDPFDMIQSLKQPIHRIPEEV